MFPVFDLLPQEAESEEFQADTHEPATNPMTNWLYRTATSWANWAFSKAPSKEEATSKTDCTYPVSLTSSVKMMFKAHDDEMARLEKNQSDLWLRRQARRSSDEFLPDISTREKYDDTYKVAELVQIQQNLLAACRFYATPVRRPSGETTSSAEDSYSASSSASSPM